MLLVNLHYIRRIYMKQNILIVEDEPAIVDAIRYALETDGYATTAIATASSALSLLQSGKVDLIILDIGLPDMSGIELCKQIRTFSTVPVIFLTARSSEVDRVVGLEIGGDDYLVKPFSPRELAARVKAVLRRIRPKDSPVFTSAGFIIDQYRRQISYFGTTLQLSRYEYKILTVFIKQPGRVFTREQLMAKAWEEPDTSMDRTVDAHIKNLRAKLRAVRPGLDPIVTHRGFGYSLEETV